MSPALRSRLLLLLALAVSRLGSITSSLGVLLRFSGVLLTLGVVILAMLFGRLAMGLRRIIVMLGRLVVFVLCHCMAPEVGRLEGCRLLTSCPDRGCTVFGT